MFWDFSAVHTRQIDNDIFRLLEGSFYIMFESVDFAGFGRFDFELCAI